MNPSPRSARVSLKLEGEPWVGFATIVDVADMGEETDHVRALVNLTVPCDSVEQAERLLALLTENA